MNKLVFKFSQLDSWFFRESRPMESVGGSELSSLFPPPVTTLSGAIRTLLGDIIDIDWQAYKQNKPQQLSVDIDQKRLLGHGEDCADLRFSYPVIEVYENKQWLPLTPAPLDLLEQKEGKALIQLSIGKSPIRCDLGNVRLPELAAGVMGAQPLEQVWLKPQGWRNYCSGKLPDKEHLVYLADLIQKESRLGIARDNRKGTVEPGLLYQTEHLRLNKEKFSDIRINCVVSGIPKQLNEQLTKHQQAVRFGGEGRLAFVDVDVDVDVDVEPMKNTQIKSSPPNNNKAKLVFNAPSYFSQSENQHRYLPADFVLQASPEGDHYCGSIQTAQDTAITFKVIAQVTAKALKIGGWDHAKHQPKPLRNFMPVGCCWYIESDQLEELATQLMGELSQFGYGAFTLLPWHD